MDISSPKINQKPKNKLKLGILGATGLVGQHFVRQLENHPLFQITCLGSSSRSAGKLYKDAINWTLPCDPDPSVMELPLTLADPKFFSNVDFVFSALPSSVAPEIEKSFSQQNIPVISNTKSNRMVPDVPLITPFVNSMHIHLLKTQLKNKTSKGFILTNPNCTTTGLVIALAPIHKKFKIEKILVFSAQAISGAGIPGVAALEINDNVIPFIPGEEEKLETEPNKIFGVLGSSGHIDFANISISAHCNRVPVIHGHTIRASIKIAKPASKEELISVLENYEPEYPFPIKRLQSQPQKVIHYLNSPGRPQPRLDRNRGNGFITSVGQISKCNVLDWKITIVSHNAVIGAAAGAILNAELALETGYLKK